MAADRRTASILGMLLIGAILCGLFSTVPAIEQPGYLARLQSIEARVFIAAFFQAVMAVLYVLIAVVTYPLVKMDDGNSAFAYLAFRLIGAAFLFLGIVALLMFVAIGRLYAQADAGGAADLARVGGLLRQARDGLNHIGMVLPWSIGGVLLYRAFLRTGLVPRWLSICGLVAVALSLVATVLYLFDRIQLVTTLYLVLNMPTLLVEVTLATRLITRGFGRAVPARVSPPAR